MLCDDTTSIRRPSDRTRAHHHSLPEHHVFFPFTDDLTSVKKENNNKQTNKQKQKQKQNKTNQKQGGQKIRELNSPSLNLSQKVERRGKECKQNYPRFEELKKGATVQTMHG